VACDDGLSQQVVCCGRRYSLADVCPASLPVQGRSIGLDTSHAKTGHPCSLLSSLLKISQNV